MPRCREFPVERTDATDSSNIVVLFPESRDDYPEDHKEPIACRLCGTLGFARYAKSDIDEITPAPVFECWDCTIASKP